MKPYLKLIYSRDPSIDREAQKERERRFVLHMKVIMIGHAAHRENPERFNAIRESIHLIIDNTRKV